MSNTKKNSFNIVTNTFSRLISYHTFTIKTKQITTQHNTTQKQMKMQMQMQTVSKVTNQFLPLLPLHLPGGRSFHID